jgi:predicted AlkP superfamily phosphohydrolase/phosphomutase
MAEGTPYEPPGLMSLLTGRLAADHGFFSYWTVHDPAYRPKVLTSADRRYPMLWENDELAGLTFACIGVAGTHPPEPLNGFLITYPMYATLHACYPRNLQRDLAARGIRPVHDVSIFWAGQSRDEILPRVLDADAQRGQAALTLFDDGADAVIVNLTSIDRTSHFYWQELEVAGQRDSGNGVLAAYQVADQVISEAMRRVDDHTSLIVFSEIGFGPLRAYCSINEVLSQHGLVKLTAAGTVDYAGSLAFEAVQGTHGININLSGRYEGGIVPLPEYERTRETVAQALAESLNPRTGTSYFKAVHRREKIYPGAALELAPDLILEPADWRYLPLGDPQWASHVHREWQSGWHRPYSCWAAVGPPFPAGLRLERAVTPSDITATMHDVLGRQVPDSCAGSTLVGQR